LPYKRPNVAPHNRMMQVKKIPIEGVLWHYALALYPDSRRIRWFVSEELDGA